MTLLSEVMDGFCYRDAASRANAYGLLLTPLLREALSGQVPLMVITRPSRAPARPCSPASSA